MRRSMSAVIGWCGAGCSILGVFSSLVSLVRQSHNDCEFAMALGDEDYVRVESLLKRGASPNTDVYRFVSDVGCLDQAWTFRSADSGGSHCPALIYTLMPMRRDGVGNTGMARLLIERGAQPEVTDWEGNTPLIVASRYGNAEIVSLLLAMGVNRSPANNKGLTALDAARRNGHREVVMLLSTGKR